MIRQPSIGELHQPVALSRRDKKCNVAARRAQRRVEPPPHEASLRRRRGHYPVHRSPIGRRTGGEANSPPIGQLDPRELHHRRVERRKVPSQNCPNPAAMVGAQCDNLTTDYGLFG